VSETFPAGSTVRHVPTNRYGVVLKVAWWGVDEHVVVNTAPPEKPEWRKVWRVAECEGES
jgi:hypothetical protein